MNRFIAPSIRESIAVQKLDVEKLKNEINGTDKKGESTYIKEFVKEYRSYAEISSYVEQWLAGAISEKEFLRRIRYDSEWGYEWENYREIFLTAKGLRIAVKGLDCELRKDLRKIRKRDFCVATKIVEILQQNSQAQLLIFVGESHLAESHLPGKVRSALKDGGQALEDIVIVQNMDSIYWALMRQKYQADVVKIEPNKFCVLNSTPLEKYRSYERAILRWEHQDEDHV